MSDKLKIELKILNPSLGSKIDLPTYSTLGSAAVDLRCCMDGDVLVEPGRTITVNTGLAIHISDPNIVGIIVPRSGLGMKNGIVLSNLTGVIDSDYTGELIIGVWNRSDKAYTIKPGDRICQLMFVPIIRPTFTVVDEFSVVTERGSNGFGHTGYN